MSDVQALILTTLAALALLVSLLGWGPALVSAAVWAGWVLFNAAIVADDEEEDY